MAHRLARGVGQQVLLGDIRDVFALRVLREQVIERLVLARPHLGRNRLVPFLGVVEFRVDVEHDAAEWKQPVADHLADLELGVAHLAHARADIVQDCGARQCPDSEVRTSLQHVRMRTSESRDTGNSMNLVPLLNPKFANTLAAKSCELRVRGTSETKDYSAPPAPGPWPPPGGRGRSAPWPASRWRRPAFCRRS